MTIVQTLISPVGFEPAWLAIRSPIQTDNPEVTAPLAKANPLPKSKIIPHGSLIVVSQFINFEELSDLAGMRYNKNATAIAIFPSLMNEDFPLGSITGRINEIKVIIADHVQFFTCTS